MNQSNANGKPNTSKPNTNKSDIDKAAHFISAASLNINALQLLEIAKRWHSKIDEELASPILPDDINQETLEAKTKAISLQREKHRIYSRALEALIRTSQKQKEKHT